MERNNNEELRTPNTPVRPNDPDIVWNLCGYPENSKYPPDIKKYGTRFSGYATETQESLFYNFAVLQYDIRFRYKGTLYYLGSFEGFVAVTDAHFNEEYEVYPYANALLENFKIEGHPLINLINELEDVESV